MTKAVSTVIAPDVMVSMGTGTCRGKRNPSCHQLQLKQRMHICMGTTPVKEQHCMLASQVRHKVWTCAQSVKACLLDCISQHTHVQLQHGFMNFMLP